MEVLYRAFGATDPEVVRYLTQTLRGQNVSILTTENFGQTHSLRNGENIILTDYTNQEAGERSAGFLNQGLARLSNKGQREVLLLASGFERDIGFIDRTLAVCRESVPSQDVYFFITPSVHNVNWQELFSSNEPIDMYAIRRSLFPSESIAYVDIHAIYPLNENLTIRGALGFSEEGIPLGGIELLVTLLEKYSNSGKTNVPSMCGIYTPHIRRDKKFYSEIPGIGRIDQFLDPVEFTTREVKDGRREHTIDAALSYLGLSSDDYNHLFSKTVLVDGTDFWWPADL